MSDSERIASLEARLQVFEDFFKFGRSEDGRIPFCETQGRLGVQTRFWSTKPWGQGAAFSVGTESDRYAGYFENEAVFPNQPATGIMVQAVVPNPGQPNVAIEAYARGSTLVNAVMYAQGEGIYLDSSTKSWVLGVFSGLVKRLWP
jgi:hypothetical protein